MSYVQVIDTIIGLMEDPNHKAQYDACFRHYRVAPFCVKAVAKEEFGVDLGDFVHRYCTDDLSEDERDIAERAAKLFIARVHPT